MSETKTQENANLTPKTVPIPFASTALVPRRLTHYASAKRVMLFSSTPKSVYLIPSTTPVSLCNSTPEATTATFVPLVNK